MELNINFAHQNLSTNVTILKYFSVSFSHRLIESVTEFSEIRYDFRLLQLLVGDSNSIKLKNILKYYKNQSNISLNHFEKKKSIVPKEKIEYKISLSTYQDTIISKKNTKNDTN